MYIVIVSCSCRMLASRCAYTLEQESIPLLLSSIPNVPPSRQRLLPHELSNALPSPGGNTPCRKYTVTGLYISFPGAPAAYFYRYRNAQIIMLFITPKCQSCRLEGREIPFPHQLQPSFLEAPLTRIGESLRTKQNRKKRARIKGKTRGLSRQPEKENIPEIRPWQNRIPAPLEPGPTRQFAMLHPSGLKQGHMQVKRTKHPLVECEQNASPKSNPPSAAGRLGYALATALLSSR